MMRFENPGERSSCRVPRDGAAAAYVPHGASELRVEPARIDEFEQRAPRVRAGDNQGTGQLLAVREHDTRDAPVAHGDARHFGVMADLDARQLGEHLPEVRARRPEHAWATADMMVEQAERRAAGTRALLQ